MEDNYKTAWASYTYIKEITKYRPMRSGEESLLNTYGQTGWMCGMCDKTFDTEYMMRKHLTSFDEQEICRITGTVWPMGDIFTKNEIENFSL